MPLHKASTFIVDQVNGVTKQALAVITAERTLYLQADDNDPDAVATLKLWGKKILQASIVQSGGAIKKDVQPAGAAAAAGGSGAAQADEGKR